jgi:hypothetical protein
MMGDLLSRSAEHDRRARRREHPGPDVVGVANNFLLRQMLPAILLSESPEKYLVHEA